MQPLDPADPRNPSVQIAASIRAAILNAELEPGAQLPSGEELAKFFGVTRVTVGSAIRTLREEGFLRSQAGSGVYVRDQANLPVESGKTHALAGVASFLFESGHLKNTPRTGWLLLGINPPESVAEHTFRVGIIGMALAAIEGADPGHVAALCLMHDLHETRIADVPSVGRAYVTTAVPEAITAHQTADMPHHVAETFRGLTTEYEAVETLEAKLAKDADKLETLLQALEYRTQGFATEEWQRTSVEALRTKTAQELAQAIMAGHPHDWFSAFQASYHELRASAKNRTTA